MKIRKLILKNFRGHINSEIEFDPNFNAIVGKNDVGKSSILEALDIFLEGGAVKIDVSDCSVYAQDKKITIGLVLEVDKNKEYLLDKNVRVKLSDEKLLNEDGFLEIHKVWSCHTQNITATNLSIHLNAHYFSELAGDPLICKKNSDLKDLLKDRGLTCDDERVNSLLRKEIHDSITDTGTKNALIQLDKEDAKKTWESIKKELPMFFLFQSDRANRDSDKEVQDPLKAITKQAILGVEEELNKVKEKIEEDIKELSDNTLKKLRDMDSALANKLTPDIKNKPWESLFSFSFQDDEGIPINKRGSGVRRLITLNYFRAEAERKNTTDKYTIYAIEEPETSQHPDYQVMLVNALQELGSKEKVQIIVTTHTPEIAKLCYENNILHLIRNGTQVSVDTSQEKLINVARTLGILPYLCKFSIFVEGTNDVAFLKTVGKNIPELKRIFDFGTHEDVSILPLLGGNLGNWITKGYVDDSNIKGFYLFDSDKEENKQKAEEVNSEQNGSQAHTTKFLMMENYFSPSLLKDKFNVTFSDAEKRGWNKRNVVDLIAEKTSQDKKDIKGKINKELSSKVTKESLEEIGAWEEVSGWFKRIKEMYEAA